MLRVFRRARPEVYITVMGVFGDFGQFFGIQGFAMKGGIVTVPVGH
ncbi:MAG: hypothetical protein ACR2O1_13505 [Boseongicola sp.]